MTQILTLSVTALKEKLYVAFMIIVNNMLDEFDGLGEKFEFFVNQFQEAYDRLNFVYLKTDLKFYTERVQEHDTERCKAFRSLRDMVRYIFTFPTSAEKGEAARVLLEVIKLYGTDIPAMKMNERTAQLVNLIEDFEDKYNAQVEVAGVGTLLEDLRRAQNKFMEVYSARLEADSNFGPKAMVEARKQMDEAYRDLVGIVNLEAKRGADGNLMDFINRMNVEIRKNFVYTGQTGSSAASGSGSEAGEESGVIFKNATFIFANGNEVKLKVEVGTPLIAPDNTEGYEWKPEVPALMPKRSVTYREVLIEAAEVTATFHFFDHTEEEITQKVGTTLEAPQNTEGYYWDPTVPATMPDEDTSYYELPEAERKYTVTWYGVDGTPIVSYDLPAGNMVPDAPTPPEGYKWPHTPMVMPSRNLEIRPEPIEG